MPFFANRDVNRIGLHVAAGTLATSLSYTFSAVFLIRAGMTPAQIFLAFAVILALRFVMRPLILVVVPAIGLRRALILGTFLCALSCPVLALVDGIGLGLAAFITLAAVGQVFYCTCYHVFFTTAGDADHRGSQVSAVQALGAVANVFGPALGGVLLTTVGPWPTFGAAFAITIIGILPLLHIAEPQVARPKPPRAYAAPRTGMWLYFADGWIQVSLTTGWSLVLFQAVGGRYDSFGGTLSLAALAGALGGMALGRIIDMGHSRHRGLAQCRRSGCGSRAAVLGRRQRHRRRCSGRRHHPVQRVVSAHMDDAGLQFSQACALRVAVSICRRGRLGCRRHSRRFGCGGLLPFRPAARNHDSARAPHGPAAGTAAGAQLCGPTRARQ
jgi:MFS family permease